MPCFWGDTFEIGLTLLIRSKRLWKFGLMSKGNGCTLKESTLATMIFNNNWERRFRTSLGTIRLSRRSIIKFIRILTFTVTVLSSSPILPSLSSLVKILTRVRKVLAIISILRRILSQDFISFLMTIFSRY